MEENKRNSFIDDEKIIVGAIVSPVDKRDWVYENIASCELTTDDIPLEHNTVTDAYINHDQKKRQTCAAHAAATIKEIHDLMKNGTTIGHSAEFIYYHRANKPHPGMYGRDVFKILRTIGSIPESIYPNLPEDGTAKEPTKKMYDIARTNTIDGYVRIYTCNGLRRAIFEHGPAYLLMPLTGKGFQFWKSYSGRKERGGHSVVAVGFNTDGFIIKNSWGKLWGGMSGYDILPYADWEYVLECWVAISSTDIKEEYYDKRCCSLS